MATLKTLTITAALIAGATSLALAQNAPTTGGQPAAGGAAAGGQTGGAGGTSTKTTQKKTAKPAKKPQTTKPM